jgi:hypothetical protein
VVFGREVIKWTTKISFLRSKPYNACHKRCSDAVKKKHVIGGPANQNGCIILCVGNLADEKF